ncbi:energy coupling factor transporter S component ThiW [Geosporobacter ferrireducens]|uniref:Energy coupling factor transporter S component ThiW n=1 Tax=Geosporobacter ferrireducens TaxID=1424294 RepID=A0A1D8GG73_9FIRM|nr:energy coupling factor transporter S component ThiW [Geosporobacter ferrireducens]AOT69893.1 energy coupling factor transporter S component ThiW [Geosporobacter ferrireducens]MTI54411.1 energy coupling factor transporter S component ThiW [Geosporobacter ferrireducens]
MNTRKLTAAAFMTAIGVASAHLIYIPVGVAKCFPVQHAMNLLAAALLGPGYAVGMAFSISLLRNLLGLGSLLAFPGSMMGALLAALLYKRRRSIYTAAAGELVGTSIIGALISYPVAKYLMGREAAMFFFVGPFFFSSAAGVILGYVIFRAIDRLNLFQENSFEEGK